MVNNISSFVVYAPNIVTKGNSEGKMEMALLHNSYNNVTRERNDLQTGYNNLTKELVQLKTRYNNLTKQLVQLQTRYNNLAEEQDRLQKEFGRTDLQKMLQGTYFLILADPS